MATAGSTTRRNFIKECCTSNSAPGSYGVGQRPMATFSRPSSSVTSMSSSSPFVETVRPATHAPSTTERCPRVGRRGPARPATRCSIVNIAGQVDRRILPSLLLAGEGHVQSATPVRPRSGRAPQVVLELREVASLHGHVHPTRRLHALRVVRPGMERPEATGAAQLGAALPPVDSGRQKGRRRPTERWPSRHLAQQHVTRLRSPERFRRTEMQHLTRPHKMERRQLLTRRLVGVTFVAALCLATVATATADPIALTGGTVWATGLTETGPASFTGVPSFSFDGGVEPLEGRIDPFPNAFPSSLHPRSALTQTSLDRHCREW